jgi:hypothetical protein
LLVSIFFIASAKLQKSAESKEGAKILDSIFDSIIEHFNKKNSYLQCKIIYYAKKSDNKQLILTVKKKYIKKNA